jgi:hypothetical protein
MESNERREPQETSEDREQGTPQDKLLNDEPGSAESQERTQGDVGAVEEGGADSPADAAREGG